jgi:anti-sigma regulatory factor (Ser/Thr protein kinase)
MRIQTVIIGGAHITRLTLMLLATWLTLGWRVRRMRQAFEKQLTQAGMPKKDAQRLSAHFAELMDNMKSAVKGSMFRFR